MVAGLAAFGGGTLRDILLDRRPFFWVEHAAWLWVLLALCIGAMLFLRDRHFALTERAMQWPDALGLGLFTATGTQLALDMAMPAIVAVLMGMITAVFGGVLVFSGVHVWTADTPGVEGRKAWIRTLDAMAAMHPDLEAVTVPDQGHVPALRGRDMIERFKRFVARAEDAPIARRSPPRTNAA